MKTPEEITSWCDTMLNRHPNIEDTNFFNSIKDYMKEQRPQGEWEEPFECNGKTYHKCNHCHISSQSILIDNFCPNCGADMRKGGAE